MCPWSPEEEVTELKLQGAPPAHPLPLQEGWAQFRKSQECSQIHRPVLSHPLSNLSIPWNKGKGMVCLTTQHPLNKNPRLPGSPRWKLPQNRHLLKAEEYSAFHNSENGHFMKLKLSPFAPGLIQVLPDIHPHRSTL